MKPFKIESWALTVIDAVASGGPNEDSRVELKANWIAPEKAARLIAGHANAAHGSPILWLIGVDEKKGVTGARFEELARWFSIVKNRFNGIYPSLTNYNLQVRGKTVVALLFETDRAPFVIKNPVYGKPNGGPVEFEVPWRENNSTRTATRADLVKILAPLQTVPNLDVLEAELSVHQQRKGNVDTMYWTLKVQFYAETICEDRIVIPFHKCRVEFEIPGLIAKTQFENVSLEPPTQREVFNHPSKSLSLTINATNDEIIVSGSGRILLLANLTTSFWELAAGDRAHISGVLQPVLSDIGIPISIPLFSSRGSNGNLICKWVFSKTS